MRVEWQEKCLGDVLDSLRNGLNCKQDKSGRGSKISRIETIAAAEFNSGRVGYSTLSATQKKKFRLQRGDILFSHINSAAHVGKTALFDCDDEVYHGVNLLLLKPRSVLTPRYLEMYLKYLHVIGFWRTKCKQSVNQASVNQQDIKKVSIRYPSDLEEQERIAAILDEVFEAIDAATVHAELNFASARGLFESYLNRVFVEKGEGWVERRLGEVASTQYGLSQKMSGRGPGYKIFRMGELQDGRVVDTGSMKWADISEAEFAKYRLRPGDILFNRTNSFELVGKTGLFDLEGDYCFASYLIRVIPRANTVRPPLLSYFMNSQKFQASVKSKASRSINQANINATILSNETVTYPSDDAIQQNLTSALNGIRSERDRLQSVYTRKLATLRELKQSVLQKAFAGELTAKEAERQMAVA